MALDQYSDQEVPNSIDKKDHTPPRELDPEKAAPTSRRPWGTKTGHPGARIAPVLPHLRGYDFGDNDSIAGSDILGKQIELEAGNALQYRTCSWQKV